MSTPAQYLLPDPTTEPVYDLDLDKIFQASVAGITGIDGTLVRPRFQPVPPERPPVTTDWCGVGVTLIDPDDSPWFQPMGSDTDPSQGPVRIEQWRHEQIEVLASFYGPNAGKMANRLRNGLAIDSNMWPLEAQAIFLASYSPNAVRTAEFINTQWQERFDLAMSFRRKTVLTYTILRFAELDVHLFDDHPANKTFFDAIVKLAPPP